MDISTSEAAIAAGVTEQRVRAMIASGALEARRVGGRWVIESRDIDASRRNGRPMTTRNAWCLLALASGDEVEGVRAEERYRLRKRLARLRDVEDKALVVRSWLARRADRSEYEASDAAAVERDERAMRSGLSDARSGLTRSNEAEVYVLANHARAFERDHALFRVQRGMGNIVVHVVADDLASMMRPSALLTAADLSERSDERSLSRAALIIGDERW